MTSVKSWANGAEPGERIVYRQSWIGEEHNPITMEERQAMADAMAAHTAALVFLAQRRLPNKTLYEATRISLRTAQALGLAPKPERRHAAMRA